jgi:AcrR family transcriptional regulator
MFIKFKEAKLDKSDKRFKKAEENIRISFMELAESRGIDAVTATDIIKKAKVNRATFYAHYKDKYELIEKMEDEFCTPLLEKAKLDAFANADIVEMSQDFVVQVINYYYDNREFLKLFCGEKGDTFFWSRFSRKIGNAIKETSMDTRLKIPSEYVVASLIGLVSGILMAWAKSDFKEKPEDFAKIVYTIIKGIPGNIVKEEDNRCR